MYHNVLTFLLSSVRDLRNKAQVKASRVHKTEQDLADDGKWLAWPDFRDAITAQQREFDELTAGEANPTIASARMAHDLVLLR
jgi:hypothetical protein